jgi:hypothetical protein
LTRGIGSPTYVNVINIHIVHLWEALVPISAYLQEIPRPFWVVGMVLGFVWFWPVGLAALAYLVASGRMRRRYGAGRWYMADAASAQGQASEGKWGWGPGGNFSGWGANRAARPTSNRAFDDYRAETLRRLEDEQKEFMDYLERLRQARDKREFDQFMADRRGRPATGEPGVPTAG